MIEKISLNDDIELLKHRLERYVKLAFDSGASDVAVVPTDQIVVDERVLMMRQGAR